jgi:hypothetical protein
MSQPGGHLNADRADDSDGEEGSRVPGEQAAQVDRALPARKPGYPGAGLARRAAGFFMRWPAD